MGLRDNVINTGVGRAWRLTHYLLLSARQKRALLSHLSHVAVLSKESSINPEGPTRPITNERGKRTATAIRPRGQTREIIHVTCKPEKTTHFQVNNSNSKFYQMLAKLNDVNCSSFNNWNKTERGTLRAKKTGWSLTNVHTRDNYLVVFKLLLFRALANQPTTI